VAGVTEASVADSSCADHPASSGGAVMGAVLAKLRTPRASVKRCGSSPSSPSRRAPKTLLSPGKLVMIEAWACWSNRMASSAFSAVMASLIAVIASINPRAATPKACSTGAGWRNAGARNVVLIFSASPASFHRPACLSNMTTRRGVNRVAACGVGAPAAR
jgi:hypothetical protein